MRAFEEACRELFKGWHGVSTYKQGDTLHVHLTLSNAELTDPVTDKRALLDRFFGGTDVPNLKRLIAKKKSRHGLQSYGRKRAAP